MATNLSATTILVPGRLHERALQRLGDGFKMVRIDSSDQGLITEELRLSVKGIAAMTRIDAAFIDSLPNLEIIASFGVGYDAVDARHAGSRGIMVTNTPDVLTEEVADTALGLLLTTVRELYHAEKWLRDGRWVKDGAYPLTKATLRGRRAGILGMGRIGKAIARRLEAFGISVAYHNRNPVPGLTYAYHASLEALAADVDTLISIAPGGASTDKIVNARVLAALGADGVFINIGRGSTVDEAALADALAKGTIMAAGLDVFSDEPNVPQALLGLPNATLFPHVGSASVHTRNAMADLVVDNLGSWFSTGKPLTPVVETQSVVSRRG